MGTRCNEPGCRAWAMRGTSTCRAHAPGALRTGGAPAGNLNARTHGLYARHFSETERRALEAAGAEGLELEIGALRVAIARVLGTSGDEVGAALAMARACTALAGLLRTERMLTGERSGALLDALDTVLAELGIGEPAEGS